MDTLESFLKVGFRSWNRTIEIAPISGNSGKHKIDEIQGQIEVAFLLWVEESLLLQLKWVSLLTEAESGDRVLEIGDRICRVLVVKHFQVLEQKVSMLTRARLEPRVQELGVELAHCRKVLLPSFKLEQWYPSLLFPRNLFSRWWLHIC